MIRAAARARQQGLGVEHTACLSACFSCGPSSLQEFVKDAGSYSKKVVDDLLDQITGGDHSRTLFQLKQVGCTRTGEGQVPLGCCWWEELAV